MYGFYSQKQRETTRRWNARVTNVPNSASVYLTPQGEEVICTEVCKEDKPFGEWDDYVRLGEVVRWVRGID